MEENKKKKENPKKVYERLKKYRALTKNEKLEITGLSPLIKEEFKNLDGMDKMTASQKLKALIDNWNGKDKADIIFETLENSDLDNSDNLLNTMKTDEFGNLINEISKMSLNIINAGLLRFDVFENLENDKQFLIFVDLLKAEGNFRYEFIYIPEKVHKVFRLFLIKQIDNAIETALGKNRGVSYFVLLSKDNNLNDMVYYKDSSLENTLNFYFKVKYSKKIAKDKFSFLSGRW